jgi:uncharacterized protein YneR
MRNSSLITRRAAALLTAGCILFSTGTASAQENGMKKMTPVLLVEEVEPCLAVWERLGFEKTMEVPEGDRIGFAAMKNGSVELMYQTSGAVAADLPALADLAYTRDGLLLFIEVEDLADVQEKLDGAEGVVHLFAERETFYGSREIGIRTPCGTHVVFAEFPEGDESGQ